jgi:hypothetical protein
MVTVSSIKGFSKKNSSHLYVGRLQCHRRPGEFVLGNPFRIGQRIYRDGQYITLSRESVIAEYRKYLWEQISSTAGEPLRHYLRSIPDHVILFCHCSPLPCHAEIIARAIAFLKSEEGLRRFPPPRLSTDARTTRRAGDWQLPFGANKGKSLDQLAEENPGYIDWLASSVCDGWAWESTKQTVINFVSQPWVKEQLRKVEDRDEKDWTVAGQHQRIGTIWAQGIQVTIWDNRPVYDVFIPSIANEQAKRWRAPKTRMIRAEYGQDDPGYQPAPPIVTGVMTDESHCWYTTCPGEYQERPRPVAVWDADRRPANMVTVNTRWAQTRASIVRDGILTEHEMQLAEEPPAERLTASRAWEMLAQISIECDSAQSREDVPTAKHLLAKDLEGWVKTEALDKVRAQYRALPA